VLCQLCGAANPDGIEQCRRCGSKLLVVSGVDSSHAELDDEMLIEAQEQLEEHLLERITALEEAVHKFGSAVSAFGDRQGQVEQRVAVAHAGVENLAGLLEDEGIVTRAEVVVGWERTAGRELLARDLWRRFRATEGRIISHAEAHGNASEEFARKLRALEPALLDRDLEGVHGLLDDLGKMAPANDELWSLIGETAFSTGEAEVAEQAFERVLDLRGPHFESLLLLGNSAAELGHWSKAEDALSRARNMAPESFLPHFALGGVGLRRGDHRGAAQHLEASLDRDETPQALYLLGSCRLELGETGRAINAFKRAIELDPTFEEAMERLAEAYLRRGWTRLALEAFRRLEQHDPQCLFYREAVRLLDQPDETGLPSDVELLLDRAEHALANGRTETAFDLIDTAAHSVPDATPLRVSAALLASILGRPRLAVAHARAILDREPDGSPHPAAATAAVLESLRSAGRPRAAARIAATIHSASTDDFCRGIAAYELAITETELGGDLARARALAREALERAPRELRRFPLVALASIALKRGSLHEARSYIERATDFGVESGRHRIDDPMADIAETDASIGDDRVLQSRLDREFFRHIRRVTVLARTLARH
jgi:tetratricopeptide (TPR) repeat protein